jgi:hypothetical protein
MSTALAIGGGATGRFVNVGVWNGTDEAKNKTGIWFAGGGTSAVSGQFYGGGVSSRATEAVGTFTYQEGAAGVRGSFGVKR